MKKNTAVWIVVIVVVLVIVGIFVAMNNKNQNSAATNPQTTSTTSSGLNQAIVLNMGTSATLGTYLVAANGMTLYQDAQDAPGVSNCTGQCAVSWPPYTVSTTGSIVGGAGVSGAVATITRADGSMQVTYNGMPLYFWQGDSAAGDATGQNVNGFTVAKP